MKKNDKTQSETKRARFKIEIYSTKSLITRRKQWRWRVRSNYNGKIVATSGESYHNRTDMEAIIIGLQNGLHDATIFYIVK